MPCCRRECSPPSCFFVLFCPSPRVLGRNDSRLSTAAPVHHTVLYTQLYTLLSARGIHDLVLFTPVTTGLANTLLLTSGSSRHFCCGVQRLGPGLCHCGRAWCSKSPFPVTCGTPSHFSQAHTLQNVLQELHHSSLSGPNHLRHCSPNICWRTHILHVYCDQNLLCRGNVPMPSPPRVSVISLLSSRNVARTSN